MMMTLFCVSFHHDVSCRNGWNYFLVVACFFGIEKRKKEGVWYDFLRAWICSCKSIVSHFFYLKSYWKYKENQESCNDDDNYWLLLLLLIIIVFTYVRFFITHYNTTHTTSECHPKNIYSIYAKKHIKIIKLYLSSILYWFLGVSKFSIKLSTKKKFVHLLMRGHEDAH